MGAAATVEDADEVAGHFCEPLARLMTSPDKGRASVGQGGVGADFVQLAGSGAPKSSFWEAEAPALAHDGARPLGAPRRPTMGGEARGKVGGARRPLSRALGTIIDPRGTSAASSSTLPAPRSVLTLLRTGT